MSWIWPGFLLLLLLVPALAGLYVWMLRRRRRYAVRFSSLSLVREAIAPHAWWRRHLPFALFLLGLAGLMLALARPVAVVQVPSNQTTILLAMDVSRSMCATDIEPSRIAAAQEAALNFVRTQPEGTKIGVVAFAGFSELIQEPTTDRKALEAAIAGLTTARGTAIGSGILTSLTAIADINPEVAPLEASALAERAPAQPATEYVPQIVVLLTDGVTTTGAPPLLAAQLAAERGVRIYTIGFGTENGSMARLTCPGQSFGGQQFGGGQPGGGQFGGGGFRRGIDEETLAEIAELTGGDYYAASSAGELRQVFADLPISFVSRPEETEVSAVVAAAGALLAALAVCLSLLWNPLP
jgi:Ca-activated chloride channel family protein